MESKRKDCNGNIGGKVNKTLKNLLTRLRAEIFVLWHNLMCMCSTKNNPWVLTEGSLSFSEHSV